MTDERMYVLQMVASGQVTPEDGGQLLAALDQEGAVPPGVEPAKLGRPKYLRIIVEEDESGHEKRVNVRVPIQLLRAGMKLGTMLPDRAKDKVNDVLREKGASDLAHLRPEDLDLLLDNLDDMTVDMEGKKNATVRFLVER